MPDEIGHSNLISLTMKFILSILTKFHLQLRSPLLERLEKKCLSKEEITEEDFMLEPMEKVPKLTEDWCEDIAKEEDDRDNKGNQEEEAMEEDTRAKDDAVEKPEHGSVPYFRLNAKL